MAEKRRDAKLTDAQKEKDVNFVDTTVVLVVLPR